MNTNWQEWRWQTFAVALVLLLVLLGAALVLASYTSAPAVEQGTATTTDNGTATGGTKGGGSGGGAPVAGPGEHCGGFIKNAPVCGTGYHCQLTVSRPDTGGSCVADGSGVKGTVMLGPTCPVERMPPDPACADKPYATTITITKAGFTQVMGRPQSAADGTYSFALPAGTYTVSASKENSFPRCAPVTVTVGENGYAVADISCDSGIR